MKRAYSFSPTSFNAMDVNDDNEVMVAVAQQEDMYQVSGRGAERLLHVLALCA